MTNLKFWPLALLYTLTMLLLPISVLPTHAKETSPPSKKIRVGFPIQQGLTELDENGNYSGYTYDYLNTLSQYTNWEYEFVTVPGDINESLTAMLDMLSRGEIDLLGATVKNEASEALYSYPDVSYGVAYSTLSILENNTKITESNLSTELSTIGVLKSAKQKTSELQKYCSTNMITAEFLYYENETDLKQALYSHKVDAILGVDLSPILGTRIVASFSGSPYYFATTKGNTSIVDSLNLNIRLLNEADSYLQSRLYEKYFSSAKSEFTLSPDEETFLKNLPDLKVLIADDRAPYHYFSEDAAYRGITISVLDSFADITGLNFEYISRSEQLSLEEQIEAENISLVAGIPSDPSFSKSHRMVASLPYVSAEISLFSTWTLDMNHLDEKTAALPVDTLPLENFSDSAVIYYTDLAGCIDAIDNGSADFGYADSYSVDYYLSRGIFPNVTVLPLFAESNSLSIGLTQPLSTPLLNILNRYINKIDDNLVHAALMKEMLAESRNLSLTDYIRLQPFESIIILLMVLAVFIAILYLLLRSRQKQNILKAQNAAKNIFLSNISHEMRTPLNAIIGLNRLQSQDLANFNTVTDCNTKILTASNHLLQIINDVLDMSQINEGRMKITEAPFSLRQMLNTIELVYRPMAEQNAVTLLLDIDTAVPDRILTDELHLKQVLINLVSNAIKYNGKGGKVVVHISIHGSKHEESGKLKFFFQVEDNGFGIHPDYVNNIFKAFERDEHYGHNTVDGTGLGLAISYEIVQLLGSELCVESILHKGSHFYFTLELNTVDEVLIPASQKTGAMPDYDLTGRRILVVEDNETNTLIVQKLLEFRHAIVETAENGLLGCQMFEASTPFFYDLILMDIRMPVMDGYKATAYIRSLQREDAKKVGIIAVSANAFLEDLNKSAAAGMDSHISKPLNPDDLYYQIHLHLTPSNTP